MLQRQWAQGGHMRQPGLKYQGRTLSFVSVQHKKGIRKDELAGINTWFYLFISYLFSMFSTRTWQVMKHILSFLFSGLLTTFVFLRRQWRRYRKPSEMLRSGQAQRKVAEQDLPLLQQDTNLEDSFISMVSHELKTPMTTISGHAQLMLRRLSRLPELSSDLAVIRIALERIDGQTRRLNALVDDLLDLNSIRSGKVEFHFSPCNIVDICREAMEEQHLLSGRQIEFQSDYSGVMMQGDADRLSQVMINLLNNAVKYSPEESPVRMLLHKAEQCVVICVQDAGPGIPEEQMAHIFEPFYRGPEVRASQKSGLGLGLAICKEIVERHHGTIWCESQVGAGSSFFVALPL